MSDAAVPNHTAIVLTEDEPTDLDAAAVEINRAFHEHGES
ncbi:MAG: hypothetical protein QOI20_1544 [Acidimicrobiaceae bacterium]|jgi:hypothetical protein|nr:hypothetical protein [Acidimicrobiaceae bacterium]